MDATLLRALLFVTVALGAVLLVRRPVRRAFGAAPAFGLWLLPVLAMALPWLPGLPAHWTVLPAIRALPASIVAAGSDAASSAHGWRWLWLLGAGAMLLRLAVQYLRLRRQGRPLPRRWRTACSRCWMAWIRAGCACTRPARPCCGHRAA